MPVTLQYGKELEKLGVDYLHIDSVFGFPNPKGNPGTYPVDGFKLFANATRHLSFKANVRAAIFTIFQTAATGFRPKHLMKSLSAC